MKKGLFGFDIAGVSREFMVDVGGSQEFLFSNTNNTRKVTNAMMKKVFFLLIAGVLFSGCADKEPAKDYQSSEEIFKKLDNLNNGVDTTNNTQTSKVNTYIIKNPAKSEALRTKPKIMETLFLGYVDNSNNQISDYYVNTVIDNGDWVNKSKSKKDVNNMGSINE